MKIALVTTPWSSPSGIADYTRHLLPYLREGADVQLFVEVGREAEACGEETPRSVAELEPREYDAILYQLGNEAQHAFMAPLVRHLGGTVMLHDWVLFDLAMAAYPGLHRGGLRGACTAYQQGGLEEFRTWWRARRTASGSARGWFESESGGRWSAVQAPLCAGLQGSLRLDLHVPPGRSCQLLHADQVLWESGATGEVSCEVALACESRTAPVLQVRGAGPLGRDTRELGVFLRALGQRVAGRWRALELDTLPGIPHGGLCDARFELALNHSIIRHADSFLVHSDLFGERILASRNCATPICRVHHGVEPRWKDGARGVARTQLGLSEDWGRCFLLASFGALQAHKRPDILLDGLRVLRDRGVDARLLCIGDVRPAEFDLRRALEVRDLQDCVHMTGWLPEREAWRALHASDLCINLRGPSTGGISGGACQALSMGRAVIVSDLPEFSHLPGACVLRVSHEEGEATRLAGLVETLAADPARLAELERAAREVVLHELHWRHSAARYLQALASFPRARASRRSLLVRFMHATAKETEGVTAPLPARKTSPPGAPACPSESGRTGPSSNAAPGVRSGSK